MNKQEKRFWYYASLAIIQTVCGGACIGRCDDIASRIAAFIVILWAGLLWGLVLSMSYEFAMEGCS